MLFTSFYFPLTMVLVGYGMQGIPSQVQDYMFQGLLILLVGAVAHPQIHCHRVVRSFAAHLMLMELSLSLVALTILPGNLSRRDSRWIPAMPKCLFMFFLITSLHSRVKAMNHLQWVESQQKVSASYVVVIGLGGVGSHAASMLLRWR